MSHKIPPYSARSKNHSGRAGLESLWGAVIRTCNTLPMRPDFTSSPAFSAASLWILSA